MTIIRRSIVSGVGVCLTAFVLSACGEVRDAVYQSKAAPDEFAVYTRAPLSLPPDYSLRPPNPGEGPRNTLDPKGTAQQAVFGQSTTEPVAAPAGASSGVVSILERTGALESPADIRAQIERETSILLEEDDRLADKIMFWRADEPFGTVLDATKEQDRIQENQALGKPLNEGDVPIIQRRGQSTFDKLLF